MKGIKHLIQCHCTLPQFRNRAEPVFHKFAVFSILDANDEIMTKFALCENCGVIHKVFDLCKSELLFGVEDTSSILSIKDIAASIPIKVEKLLKDHSCDLATWENVKFIFDNLLWEETIVLGKDQIGDSMQIKTLVIESESKFTIESHTRQEEIRGEYIIL